MKKVVGESMKKIGGVLWGERMEKEVDERGIGVDVWKRKEVLLFGMGEYERGSLNI